MFSPRVRSLGLFLALALLALGLAGGEEPRPPTARIEWREVEGARAYEIEVRDLRGTTVYLGRSDKAFLDLALPPDTYRMRIVALNVFLKPASESPWMELGIVRAVLPLVASVEPGRLPLGLAEAHLLIRGEGVFRGTRVRLERGGLLIRGEPLPLPPETPAEPAAGAGQETGEPESPAAGLVFRFELGKALPGDYDLVLENPGGMRTLVKAALGLRAPPEYWLGLRLPPFPEVESLLPEPEPPQALGFGPVERDRWGGGKALASRSGLDAGGPGRRPERRPRLSIGWSQGLLLDPEFAYLYGPSYLGAALGFELPLKALFPPPAFLRGGALEARLGVQAHPALLSSGAEGKILFGNLGGGLSYGTDFASPLNLAARLGGEALLTSLDSANPFFPGSLLSIDPALYAGAALRFEQGRQRWELGLEWSGTFYLDFFMNRLRAGLSWGWGW